MGTFTHPITLISESGQRETFDAEVDADLLFAVFPASALERLGVEEERGRRRRIGQAEAELDGNRMHIMCGFGGDDEPVRIGRHTLDTFLLEADFEKQALVPKTFQLIQHF